MIYSNTWELYFIANANQTWENVSLYQGDFKTADFVCWWPQDSVHGIVS